MDALLQDLRYALRTLRGAPGFALAAVVTLALGIGANAALFSLLDGVMLRAAPGVRDAGRLAWVSNVSQITGRATGMSYADFADLRAASRGFEGMAAVAGAPVALAGAGGDPVRLRAEVVSGSYFSVLGVQPQVGRAFAPDEDRAPETHPVVVIGDALWRGRFGGDAGIVGRTVAVNGRDFTVIGVAPAGFRGFDVEKPVDVWMPAMMAATAMPTVDDILTRRADGSFLAIGRLRDGVSAGRAEAELRSVAAGLAREHPQAREGLDVGVASVRGLLRPTDGGEAIPLFALGAAVTGIVLLIACANVAALLLGRAAARRREIGIRLALGASRGRVVRQLLVESVVLSLGGGALGLLVAVWATQAFLATFPALPIGVKLNAATLGVTLALAMATGVGFGLVPALRASRPDVVPALKDAGGGGGMRRSRLQRGLVAAQVALSCVLLVAAGLLVRTLSNASRAEVGFTARSDVLTLSIDLGVQGYDRERARAFHAQLVERAEALPGVSSASVASLVPMNGVMWGVPVQVEAANGTTEGAPGSTYANYVWPEFFRTLGIALVRGREFTDGDRDGAAPVVIVNEAAAERWWPGADPIGRRVRVGGEDTPLRTVVGVARTGRYDELVEDPRPYLYLPEMQVPGIATETTLVVRARGDAGSLAAPLRETVRGMDPRLPVFGVRTMDAVLRERLEPKSAGRAILAAFGGLAALLAMVGLYGVMAFSVAQRVREVGVRRALGAGERDVWRLFVGEGVRLAAMGIAAGLLMAVGMTQVLRNALYGVGPTDAATFLTVAALLAAVAALASWLPARRAARLDPMTALRTE